MSTQYQPGDKVRIRVNPFPFISAYNGTGIVINAGIPIARFNQVGLDRFGIIRVQYPDGHVLDSASENFTLVAETNLCSLKQESVRSS